MAVIHAYIPCRMANQIAIFVPIPRRLIADVLINMLQVRPAREHFYLTYRFLIGKGWRESTLIGSELGDAKFFCRGIRSRSKDIARRNCRGIL